MSTTLYNQFSTLYDMPRRRRRESFGERIAQIIRDEGISAADLARAVGVTRATVSEWIKGRSKLPSADVPFAIEDLYGYSARWVATGEGEPKAKKFDPADTVIIENLEKLRPHPDRRDEVRAFLDYQVNRGP